MWYEYLDVLYQKYYVLLQNVVLDFVWDVT